MAGVVVRPLLRRHPYSSTLRALVDYLHQLQPLPPYSTSSISPPPPSTEPSSDEEKKGKWLVLQPFSSSHVDPASVGKDLFLRKGEQKPQMGATTAFKWIRRCCPGIPANLVQKLFRLRQVKRQVAGRTSDSEMILDQDCSFKRVSAKYELNHGDVILLPASVHKHSPDKNDHHCTNDEMRFLQSLELHKDGAIVVLNKPHGMPVQGGVDIKLSIDILAAKSLKYDYEEPPKLVHRLDRDCSGILVLARTQTSAAILHSIFREKTFWASNENNKAQKLLQRKYWALVIGKPKRSSGKISAPLSKVIVETGKSERIAVSHGASPSSQMAITEYKIMQSYENGLSWLELRPLTGRKHQLRVHCAEVLGTPIVGDYKYGWHAQRKWVPAPSLISDAKDKSLSTHKLPFRVVDSRGSISDKKPCLHLHCRQMILPNILEIIQYLQSTNQVHDFSKIESLDLVAPLPSHMQRSWDILNH